jgi:hypothetical protein
MTHCVGLLEKRGGEGVCHPTSIVGTLLFDSLRARTRKHANIQRHTYTHSLFASLSSFISTVCLCFQIQFK